MNEFTASNGATTDGGYAHVFKKSLHIAEKNIQDKNEEEKKMLKRKARHSRTI